MKAGWTDVIDSKEVDLNLLGRIHACARKHTYSILPRVDRSAMLEFHLPRGYPFRLKYVRSVVVPTNVLKQANERYDLLDYEVTLGLKMGDVIILEGSEWLLEFSSKMLRLNDWSVNEQTYIQIFWDVLLVGDQSAFEDDMMTARLML